MAKKYYAVAKGKTPGIYFNWEDCKAQIEHFSGAVYKGFPTIAEAEEFINKVSDGREAVLKTSKENGEESEVSTDSRLIAYVDGSYEDSLKRYAYGCVLVLADKEVTLNGSDDAEDMVSMRNVAGEITGSCEAVKWAIEHGYRSVTIYYDYEGIEKWANDIWKANKPGTQRYKAFIQEKRQVIDISFRKVAAHTGVKYNELADKLAKEALGLV